jgi:hypothetical protein
MRALILVVSLVLVLPSVVRADDAPPAIDPPTIVTGRVTDVVGHPVGNARVYVTRAGERQTVTTDHDGRYKVQVDGEGTYGVVIAIDKAHTFHTVLVAKGQENKLDVEVALDIFGGEVIQVDDKKRPQPKVKAKSQNDPMKTLPYSDEAIDRDAWARAWLLLDVDETGHVTRLKLLKAPGFDLDRIAIDEGFKLTFTPALDGKDRPTKTYVLWTLEWPSREWLVQTGGVAGFHGGGLPPVEQQPSWLDRPQAPGTTYMARNWTTVPCLGSGAVNLDYDNRTYRECSKPDLSRVDALPWITRETAATAIAELARTRTEEPTVKHSKVPPIVATSITGGLVVGFVLSYMRYRDEAKKLSDPAWRTSHDLAAYTDGVERRESWKKVTIGFAVASLLSGGASVLLWNRAQTSRSFSVQATNNNGAALSYGGSFW